MEFFQLTGEPKWLNNDQLIKAVLGYQSGYNGVLDDNSTVAEMIINYLEIRAKELPHEQMEQDLLNAGVSHTQIAALKANQELFRRILYPARHVIARSSELHRLMLHHAERPEENLFLITLNAAQELLGRHFISRGSLTRTEMHPREILKVAIKDSAATIILMHNHPSGNVEPSENDIETTKRLWMASELVGIPLYDHIIFTEKEYYSFREHGKMQNIKKNHKK